jgi:hypothetical protein
MKHKRSESAETETQPILEYLHAALKYSFRGAGNYGEKIFRCAGVWTKYVYQTVKRKSTFYAEVLFKPMSSEAVLSWSWNNYFLLILQSISLFSYHSVIKISHLLYRFESRILHLSLFPISCGRKARPLGGSRLKKVENQSESLRKQRSALITILAERQTDRRWMPIWLRVDGCPKHNLIC